MILQKKLSLIIDKQIIRYCLIGGCNTFFTLSAIFILTWCGVSLYLANLVGYVFGILTSYALNSKYTFYQPLSYQRLVMFVIAVILSYLVNLLTIYIVISINAESLYLSQFFGGIVYTFIGFFLNKYWVLK